MALTHQALELVSELGKRRKYEVECERSEIKPSNKAGVLGEHDYFFRVVEDGANVVFELKHTELIHNDVI